MITRSPFNLASFLAFPLAALFAGASVGNILLPDAYAIETPLWTAQGLGQDWVDLMVVVPLLIVSAAFALHGSRLFRLILAGTLAYTAYSLVLYAFAVHFNSLFLVYAAGLGLSFYALVSIVAAFGREDVRSWFSPRAPARSAGAFATLIGVAFYALWLSELIPALAARATPKSVLDAGLITNPVQVLDVGIVLPAFVLGGAALFRRRPLGYWLVPMMLAFGVLMDLALIAMVLSMAAHDVLDAGPPLPVFVAMAGATAAVLWALLRRLASPRSACDQDVG
jgi:uncharacterized protein (TIGR03382 family)